jgi:hypothetical protein
MQSISIEVLKEFPVGTEHKRAVKLEMLFLFSLKHILERCASIDATFSFFLFFLIVIYKEEKNY